MLGLGGTIALATIYSLQSAKVGIISELANLVRVARVVENVGCKPHVQVVGAVGIMGVVGAGGVGGRENNRKVVTSICF